ncbi:MAG TPA: ATP-binding protein [Xanthomonadaceae bacterium]|nr:ATP-binding protein [Xanthomonadaceae bacterium]
MTLRSQLLAGYGAVLVLAIAGLAIASLTVGALGQSSAELAEHGVDTLDAAAGLRELAESARAELGVGTGAIAAAQVREVAARVARDGAAPLATLGQAPLADVSQRLLERVGAGWQDAAAQAQAATPSAAALSEALHRLRGAAGELFHAYGAQTSGEISAIDTQLQRVLLALLLLAVATLAAGLWISSRLAATLARPLESLADAAARVGGGDFSARVGAGGQAREIEELVDHFNQMAAAMQMYHSVNIDELIAERRRTEAVIASMDDGLLIFDHDGRVERINPVAQRQLGVRGSQVLHELPGAMIGRPEIDQAVAARLANPGDDVGRSGEVTLGEAAERRTLVWSLMPFSDVSRPGLVMVLRDVTRQRQFDRMRVDFVMRASHELRTPAAGMQMALGVLERTLHGRLDPRELELVQALESELARLLALIDRMLDLSLLYAGSAELELSDYDTAEGVRAAAARHAEAAARAGVELEVRIQEAPLPPMHVDRTRLALCLDNLIANALRHTPRGGQVRLLARALPGCVELAVADDGEGIAQEDLERVFEPFVQTGPHPGTSGLGLALCREVANLHGGEIRLVSTRGRGTEVVVRLPAS